MVVHTFTQPCVWKASIACFRDFFERSQNHECVLENDSVGQYYLKGRRCPAMKLLNDALPIRYHWYCGPVANSSFWSKIQGRVPEIQCLTDPEAPEKATLRQNR
jgi:hypothetical protein